MIKKYHATDTGGPRITAHFFDKETMHRLWNADNFVNKVGLYTSYFETFLEAKEWLLEKQRKDLLANNVQRDRIMSKISVTEGLKE